MSKFKNTNGLFKGLIIGIIFGFLLQKGGVSKYDVIMGQLRLTDFTVVKIILTAIVVTMLGISFFYPKGKIQVKTKAGSLKNASIGGLIFGIGWANIVSIINIYIRDFQPLQAILFQALFYATPIIYTVDMIPSEYSLIYLANPLYYLMEILRQPLLGQTIPGIEKWIIAFSFSLITFILGVYILNKNGRKISLKI